MPRNITVTFDDGTQHVYQNAPDDISPEAVHQRAQQEFGKAVSAMDGGRAPAAQPASAGPGILEQLDQHGKNATAGLVRGGAGVAATVIDAVRGLGDAATSATPAGMRPPGLRREKTLSDLIVPPTDGPLRGGDLRAKVDTMMRDKVGADPESLMYQGGKVGGEIAATLPLGGMVGRGLAALFPRLGAAVSSGGLSTGARVAPGVAPALADAGIRAAGGAINGAVTAGAVNPSDATTGAALGAALPVVTKVAGVAGRAIGDAVSPNMARNTSVNQIGSELGGDVPQVIADIGTYFPKGAENIPVSAAAATRNPKLAQMEQGSRLRSSPQWSEFDQAQGKAVSDNVMRATSEADQLGTRAADRQANWQEAWQKAAENTKPRLWRQRMTQFGEDLRQAELSPDSSNPAVRGVLDAINAEMDRLGPNFGLGHLQQMRANLNGKVNPMVPDAFKSAPRDNPAIISLKQEMDDILNTATGGKWQNVIEGYAADSDKLHASKAAQKVRNAFVDGETGRVRGVSLDPNGDVPKITEAGLGRAMDAARLPDKSLALSPEANDRLTATLDALRRQNIVQGVKRSATAGSGSDTMSNAIASGLGQQTGAPSLVMQAASALRQIGMGKRDQATQALLSNPDELAVQLERWLRPPQTHPGVAALYRSAPALTAD